MGWQESEPSTERVIEMVTPVYQTDTEFADQPTAFAHTRFFQAFLDDRDQKTPGRLIIITHKRIPALTEWPEEYWMEFGKFERSLELALKKAFDPVEARKCLIQLNILRKNR